MFGCGLAGGWVVGGSISTVVFKVRFLSLVIDRWKSTGRDEKTPCCNLFFYSSTGVVRIGIWDFGQILLTLSPRRSGSA